MQSATLRGLIEAIAALPIRVQVRARPCWVPRAEACTQLAGRVGSVRYLVIHVRPQRAVRGLTPLIGHELQHALEIGCDVTVIDARSLAGLFTRIGTMTGKRRYETREAVAIEAAIRMELEHRDRQATTGLRGCGCAVPPGAATAPAPGGHCEAR